MNEIDFNDEIDSIEEIGLMECIDITVDSKDHLFYANGILTHNCAYDSNAKLTLANVGESMKKVDNADFIALFQKKDLESEKTGSSIFSRDDGELLLIIGKNRSGQKDVSISFRTDFSKFLIEEAPQSTGLDVDTDLIDLDKKSIISRIESIENNEENGFV